MKLFYASLDAVQPKFRRCPTSDVPHSAVAGVSAQHRDTTLQIRWGSGRRELGKKSIDHGRGTVRINLPQISVLYTKAVRFNIHGHSLSITTMSTLFLLDVEKQSYFLLLLLC